MHALGTKSEQTLEWQCIFLNSAAEYIAHCNCPLQQHVVVEEDNLPASASL